MEINKYRKKSLIIEAVQWTGNNFEEILKFLGDAYDGYGGYKPNIKIYIQTLEGIMTASVNDYIIKGIQGEFYPCKADIFFDTYELAD